MGKYVNLFKIVYLILLLFVFANFVLGYNGYAFTPLLWDLWLYLGGCDHSESQLVSLLSKTCSKLEESCKCSFESLCYGDSSIFH